MDFGILLYPVGSKIISLSNQTVAISKYVKDVEGLDDEQIQGLKNETKYFNENLFSTKSFNASLKNGRSSIDLLKKFDTIAYITIPKININLPIYEGVDDEVLSRGIGHIPQTSIPCGGINTHSVLSGHSGLSSAKLFDSIDKLKKNDIFYITYLNETLKYKVTEINKVLPDETEKLKIEEGKDLVTLVTCTPRYINSHRLLVTGIRVNEKNKELQKVNCKIIDGISKKQIIIKFTLKFCLIALLTILFIVLRILICKRVEKIRKIK